VIQSNPVRTTRPLQSNEFINMGKATKTGGGGTAVISTLANLRRGNVTTTAQDIKLRVGLDLGNSEGEHAEAAAAAAAAVTIADDAGDQFDYDPDEPAEPQDPYLLYTADIDDIQRCASTLAIVNDPKHAHLNINLEPDGPGYWKIIGAVNMGVSTKQCFPMKFFLTDEAYAKFPNKLGPFKVKLHNGHPIITMRIPSIYSEDPYYCLVIRVAWQVAYLAAREIPGPITPGSFVGLFKKGKGGGPMMLQGFEDAVNATFNRLCPGVSQFFFDHAEYAMVKAFFSPANGTEEHFYACLFDQLKKEFMANVDDPFKIEFNLNWKYSLTKPTRTTRPAIGTGAPGTARFAGTAAGRDRAHSCSPLSPAAQRDTGIDEPFAPPNVSETDIEQAIAQLYHLEDTPPPLSLAEKLENEYGDGVFSIGGIDKVFIPLVRENDAILESLQTFLNLHGPLYSVMETLKATKAKMENCMSFEGKNQLKGQVGDLKNTCREFLDNVLPAQLGYMKVVSSELGVTLKAEQVKVEADAIVGPNFLG
jgi:hypothetical protein